MPTPFDKLLAVADRQFDRSAAEAFIMHPVVRTPNGRPTADLERPVVRGKGVFELRAGSAGGMQLGNRSFNRKRNDFRSISSSPAPRISIAENELGGVAVRQGDRLDLADRFPARRFDVVSVQPDGHGRIFVDLVEV